MQRYYPIDENPEQSLWACAFYLAQELGEPKAQAEILARVTEHYLAANEPDLAAQAVEPLYDVEDSHEREQRFAQLAGFAARHGHDDFAASFADACQDPAWQDAARHDAALAQAARGDFAAARETAFALGYPEPALVELARLAAETNEDETLALVEELHEPRSRIVVLLEVVAHRAAVGRGAEALELLHEANEQLSEVDLPDEQVETLCAVGVRFAALERHEKARELVTEAQDLAEDAADDHQLLCVADAWLALGNTERALYVVEEIDLFDTSWFIANVAHAKARAGDFAAAQTLLDTLPDNHHKGRGCLLLARVYQQQGDDENFRAQMARAHELTANSRTPTTEDVNLRDALFGVLSAEYLAAGDETKAQAIAAAMPPGAPRDEAWQRLAARETEDSRLRDALKTTENLSSQVQAETQAALALKIAQFEARTTKDWSLLRDTLARINAQAFAVRLKAHLDLADFLAAQSADDEAARLRQTARREAETHERPALAAAGLAAIAARDRDAALFSAAVAHTAPITDRYELARVLLDVAATGRDIGGELDEAAQTTLQQHLPV
jgi:hypothetical protein